MGIFDELKTVAGVLQEAGKIEQYKQILDPIPFFILFKCLEPI